jgi:SAM-dependent methyltransferase
MDKARIVSAELALIWQSRYAHHTDRSFFDRLSLWRDFFPGDLSEGLRQADVGQRVRRPAGAGELIEVRDRALVRTLQRAQFHPVRPELAGLIPRTGRFYPRNILRGVTGFYPEDRRPFRCLDVDAESLMADFNHPFAGVDATIEARIVQELEAKEERGGRCADIPAEITADGPGMQAALVNRETDFFAGEPFARLDPRPDAQFYQAPRLVQHLDAEARSCVREIYRSCLHPRMRVLDLMSSWVSHLPEDIADLDVTGLGLNREELDRNPSLAGRIVRDLNADPRLPFGDACFDAAICTVSVEYLIRPIEVFREVARVLRPGAPFVLTFSDRWFPTKVVALWTELHPFERLGLVLDYFRLSGGFSELTSESIRGRPRPADDPYAAQRRTADPVFTVSGRRRSA